MFSRIRGIFSPRDPFGAAISRTKKSENRLIDDYENMDSAIKSYHNSYDEHLANLITLDDFANFSGMQKAFKDIILKKNFKHGDVDRSNPLLFENYFINDTVTPAEFRRQHIIQQVRYVLKKYFALREHQFIRDIDAEVGKHSALVKITTIEQKRHKREIKYSNEPAFLIRMSDMKEALKQIIGSAKKHLKNEEKLISISKSKSKTSGSNEEGSRKSNSGTIKASGFSVVKRSRKTSKRRSSVAGLKSRFGSKSKSSESKESTAPISRFLPPKPKVEEKAVVTPAVTYPAATGAAGIMQTAVPSAQPFGAVKPSGVNCYALDEANCKPPECFFNKNKQQCVVNKPPAYGGPQQQQQPPAYAPSPSPQPVYTPPPAQQPPIQFEAAPPAFNVKQDFGF